MQLLRLTKEQKNLVNKIYDICMSNADVFLNQFFSFEDNYAGYQRADRKKNYV